jgi:hypothetical protein
MKDSNSIISKIILLNHCVNTLRMNMNQTKLAEWILILIIMICLAMAVMPIEKTIYWKI